MTISTKVSTRIRLVLAVLLAVGGNIYFTMNGGIWNIVWGTLIAAFVVVPLLGDLFGDRPWSFSYAWSLIKFHASFLNIFRDLYRVVLPKVWNRRLLALAVVAMMPVVVIGLVGWLLSLKFTDYQQDFWIQRLIGFGLGFAALVVVAHAQKLHVMPGEDPQSQKARRRVIMLFKQFSIPVADWDGVVVVEDGTSIVSAPTPSSIWNQWGIDPSYLNQRLNREFDLQIASMTASEMVVAIAAPDPHIPGIVVSDPDEVVTIADAVETPKAADAWLL